MLDYYTLTFIFVIYIITYPPKEFITSGITLNNVISAFLCKEMENFIEHHVYRINSVLLFYSILPLVYCLGYNINSGQNILHISSWPHQFIFLFTFSIIITMCLYIKYIMTNDRKFHPLIQNLLLYNDSNNKERNNWHDVASCINREFNVFDKYSSSLGNTSVYLTNSWIIKIDLFSVIVVQKNDIELKLAKAQEHKLSHISDFGAQILEILVYPKYKTILPKFSIRLSSFEFNQLKEALNKTIYITDKVIIKKSLADHFVEVFSAVIKENPKYIVPADITLENCLGCLVKPSEVKLFKRCSTQLNNSALNENATESVLLENNQNLDEENFDTTISDAYDISAATSNPSITRRQPFNHPNQNLDHQQSCVMCYCRPMWCTTCMAHWFASRQDQKRPEQWLSGTAPCPLCRAVFCILDVSPISM